MKEVKEESTSLSSLLRDLAWMEGQSLQGNATTNMGPKKPRERSMGSHSYDSWFSSQGAGGGLDDILKVFFHMFRDLRVLEIQNFRKDRSTH